MDEYLRTKWGYFLGTQRGVCKCASLPVLACGQEMESLAFGLRTPFVLSGSVAAQPSCLVS